MAVENALPELFRQFVQGFDFASPSQMIGDLGAEAACLVPANAPYSIATQVAHMAFWQDRWLAALDGHPIGGRLRGHEDFPVVAPEDWDRVRASFLAGLDRAAAMAGDEEALDRKVPRRGTVRDVLIKFVVHGSYHLGEISLLRQLQGVWPPAGSDDAW